MHPAPVARSQLFDGLSSFYSSGGVSDCRGMIRVTVGRDRGAAQAYGAVCTLATPAGPRRIAICRQASGAFALKDSAAGAFDP